MKTMAEVLAEINAIEEKSTRIDLLKGLRGVYRKTAIMLFRQIYFSKTSFDVTPGLKYEVDGFDDPGMLLSHTVKIKKYFIVDASIPRAKKDEMFYDMLSTFAKTDAEMMNDIIAGNFKFKNLSKDVVKKAFGPEVE